MRIAGALLAFLVSAAAASAACVEERVEIRGDFGTARFNVEIADEPAERSLGLMNRPSMPMNAGMLFVFESQQPVSFWMRNTLIPLDMLFVDETGVIARVHENAVPLDETPIPSGAPVRYVLEINGGLAAQIGIEAGDELRAHAIPADVAAWPCD